MKEKLRHIKSRLLKSARKHKLGLLNLFISIIILYKVLLIDAKLNMMLSLINQIGFMLYANIIAAADQFRAAIQSIVNLFGGDGA